MNTPQTFLRFLLLVLCLFVSGCHLTSKEFWDNDKQLAFETKFFLDKNLSVMLPKETEFGLDSGRGPIRYISSIYTHWEGVGTGDYPLSKIMVDCDKASPGIIQDKEPNALYVGNGSYERRAELIFKDDFFRLSVITEVNDKHYPNKETRDYRLAEDTKIFNQIIDTVMVNADGNWVKPKIVRK